MLLEILIVIAAVVIGLPCPWWMELRGWASAILMRGPHPFRRDSFRKRPGEQATGATHGSPPRWAVYSVGLCEQDPGPRGWAYVQVGDSTAREESGEHPDTTRLPMELTAAIKGVEATAPGSTVLVCTASQLVEQGMTGWVHKWLHNGWCTGAG